MIRSTRSTSARAGPATYDMWSDPFGVHFGGPLGVNRDAVPPGEWLAHRDALHNQFEDYGPGGDQTEPMGSKFRCAYEIGIAMNVMQWDYGDRMQTVAIKASNICDRAVCILTALVIPPQPGTFGSEGEEVTPEMVASSSLKDQINFLCRWMKPDFDDVVVNLVKLPPGSSKIKANVKAVGLDGFTTSSVDKQEGWWTFSTPAQAKAAMPHLLASFPGSVAVDRRMAILLRSNGVTPNILRNAMHAVRIAANRSRHGRTHPNGPLLPIEKRDIVKHTFTVVKACCIALEFRGYLQVSACDSASGLSAATAMSPPAPLEWGVPHASLLKRQASAPHRRVEMAAGDNGSCGEDASTSGDLLEEARMETARKDRALKVMRSSYEGVSLRSKASELLVAELQIKDKASEQVIARLKAQVRLLSTDESGTAEAATEEAKALPDTSAAVVLRALQKSAAKDKQQSAREQRAREVTKRLATKEDDEYDDDCDYDDDDDDDDDESFDDDEYYESYVPKEKQKKKKTSSDRLFVPSSAHSLSAKALKARKQGRGGSTYRATLDEYW